MVYPTLSLRRVGMGVLVFGAVVIQVAARAFPHESLSPLATMPLVHLGYLQTPLAMVVDAAGVVVRVEPVATRSPAAVARSLASHLGRP